MTDAPSGLPAPTRWHQTLRVVITHFFAAWVIFIVLFSLIINFIAKEKLKQSDDNVIFFMGAVAALIWVGFRTGRLARYQPKLFTWNTSIVALWCVIGFSVFGFNRDIYSSLFVTFFGPPGEPTAPVDQWGSILDGLMAGALPIQPLAFFEAWLSLWIFGALFTLTNTTSPRHWGRRPTSLITSVLVLFGYPAAWFAYGQLVILVGVPIAPSTTIALLLFPIIILPVCGFFTFIISGAVFATIAFVTTFVIDLPIRLFDWIHWRVNNESVRRQKFRGLADYFARFEYWLRDDPVPTPPDDSKGSRFAITSEVDALRKWDPNTSSAFGYVAGNPLMLQTDKHVLVQASTRSGKGVAVIIPHLLRYPGSAFVLDPKGENARATGRRRGELNGKVHYLDPFGISGQPQSRFNPLSRFTPENMEAESKALAAAFILGERDHWVGSAQQLLAAVIMHVYSDPAYERKDLVVVRRTMLGAIQETLEAMKNNDAGDGLVAALAASFLDTPERERGSIISTALRETEILDNPYIAACLSSTGEGTEVDFADWHQGTMTVYLCLAAPRFPTFNRWLRLVLTSALDEMTEMLRPPPLPVCFMLDELATLGHMVPVENAIGLAAGYGVTLWAVFQDTAQMRDLYKARWASFVGNAGVRVLFNLDDFDTADYWSKFIGGRFVESVNLSQDTYGITEKQSVSEVLRPLMTPDEIMLRFAAGKMLVLAQGAHPIEADRVPYYLDPLLEGLWDDPRVTG